MHGGHRIRKNNKENGAADVLDETRCRRSFRSNNQATGRRASSTIGNARKKNGVGRKWRKGGQQQKKKCRAIKEK